MNWHWQTRHRVYELTDNASLLRVLAGLVFLSAIGFLAWMMAQGNPGLAIIGSAIGLTAFYIFAWRARQMDIQAERLDWELHDQD